MKTIVYEIRAGKQECAKIMDDGSDELKIIFEEPIDGKMTVGDRVFSVMCGVVKLKIETLPQGEILPRLLTGGRIYNLEGFILKGDALLPIAHDESYIRELSSRCEELCRRLGALEERVIAAEEKITQKIKF
jgi:hypothetical protein